MLLFSANLPLTSVSSSSSYVPFDFPKASFLTPHYRAWLPLLHLFILFIVLRTCRPLAFLHFFPRRSLINSSFNFSVILHRLIWRPFNQRRQSCLKTGGCESWFKIWRLVVSPKSSTDEGT